MWNGWLGTYNSGRVEPLAKLGPSRFRHGGLGNVEEELGTEVQQRKVLVFGEVYDGGAPKAAFALAWDARDEFFGGELQFHRVSAVGDVGAEFAEGETELDRAEEKGEEADPAECGENAADNRRIAEVVLRRETTGMMRCHTRNQRRARGWWRTWRRCAATKSGKVRS